MIPNYESFIWWTGVVEDRKDPLFLGRCRVRIFGHHSKFITPSAETPTDAPSADYIPIDELPWAYPVTPVTSAAMTGIGAAPVGPVEGSWVVGFFLDGTDMQEPVIIGTIGGVEMKNDEQKPTLASTGDGTPVAPPSNTPIETTPTDAPTDTKVEKATGGVLGPLSQDDVNSLKDALGKRESSDNYQSVNTIGFVGKYQFGNANLYDRGMSKSTSYNNKVLDNPDCWTGKYGCNSKKDFLNNPDAQEKCMDDELRSNYNTLLRTGVITADSSKEDVAGYLSAAHLKGCGGAKQLKNGNDNSDAYGSSASSYYKLGAASVGGTASKPPAKAPAPTLGSQPPNFPPSKQQPPDQPSSFGGDIGFKDPNHVYPKFDDQDKRPDTNYLAYRDHIDKTHVKKKEDARKKDVEVANSKDDKWDQPLSPYFASYPYNHVIESESGHVVEMDDTDGNERINIWHKTGSFIEIDKNGTEVHKIVGDNYQIIDRNGFISIAGKCNITIEGDCNLLVKNDANIQVDGKVDAKYYGDVVQEVSGKYKLSVKEGFHVRAKSVHFETEQENGEAFTIKNKDEAGAIRIQTAGTFDVLSEKNLTLNSNLKLSIRGTGTEVAIDGHKLSLQKHSAEFAKPVEISLPGDEDMHEPDEKKDPTEPSFDDLHTNHYTDLPALFYDEPGYPPEEVDAHIQANIDNGNYDKNDLNNPPQTGEPDTTPPPPEKKEPEKCPDGFEQADNYSPALQLSSSFTLGQVSSNAVVSKYPVQDQHGLRKGAIVCNLRALCKTTLEDIKAKYPNVIVTSGFRSATTSTSKTSQHELGQAADLQFPGNAPKDYYDIACWIRDNCTYDQLLLEYKSTGTRLPWIHVSLSLDGNRKQCLTMMDNKVAAGSLNDKVG